MWNHMDALWAYPATIWTIGEKSTIRWPRGYCVKKFEDVKFIRFTRERCRLYSQAPLKTFFSPLLQTGIALKARPNHKCFLS